MVLAPFPDAGPSGLPVAPEHHPQFLLSPNLGISAVCSNSEPTENPPEEAVGARGGCSHVTQGPVRHGPIRGCLLTGERCGPHISNSHPLSLSSTDTRPASRTWWRNEFLGHWGGLSPHSSLYTSFASPLDQ
uniref:Uncharacterized protein n=1 Tax=Lynx canadensis TaxID=61383 RepID=A0A667G205_LYNCA